MSGRLQERFQADTQVGVDLMPIEQRQLIQEHSPQGETLGGHQASRRHWPVRVKDGFELFIEVLNRQGAGLVEHAAHFHAGVGMGIGMSFPPRGE